MKINQTVQNFIIGLVLAIALWFGVKANIQLACFGTRNFWKVMKHPDKVASASFYLLWASVPMWYFYKEYQNRRASAGRSRVVIYMIGVAVIYFTNAVNALKCSSFMDLFSLFAMLVILITSITDTKLTTSGRIVHFFVLCGAILFILTPNVT